MWEGVFDPASQNKERQDKYLDPNSYLCSFCCSYTKETAVETACRGFCTLWLYLSSRINSVREYSEALQLALLHPSTLPGWLLGWDL